MLDRTARKAVGNMEGRKKETRVGKKVRMRVRVRVEVRYWQPHRGHL